MASPPEVIRWAPRSQGHGDCAIAALEIACGVTYEQALSAALQVSTLVLTDGLNWPEIQQVALLLGFTGKRIRKFDLEEDTGVLNVWQPGVGRAASDHVVYLWEGRIIEPSSDRQQLWLNSRDYLSHYHYTHGALLVLKRDE